MISLKRCTLLLWSIVVLNSNGHSQTPFASLIETDSLANDSASFHLTADITQFLKNNEYFNSIVEGYTLFGTNLKTGGYYMPSHKAKVYVGLQALKYYGDLRITVNPELYLQYSFNKHVRVTMGSLSHRPETKLVPVLTNHETILTEPATEGLAFAFDKRRFQGDIWVAWLQFLHPYEHSQEKIFLGNAFEYKLLQNKLFEIGIPIQFTAYHIGGQINDEWMPLHMIANNAVGLSCNLKQEKRTIKARYFYVGYTDLSSVSDYDYQMEMAILPIFRYKQSIFKVLWAIGKAISFMPQWARLSIPPFRDAYPWIIHPQIRHNEN
jgi:hypothetical protein